MYRACKGNRAKGNELKEKAYTDMKQRSITGIRLTALAAWLLVAASCSDETQPESPGESRPVKVEAAWKTGAVTKAGNTPITTDGAEIGLFRTTGGGYSAQYNVKYTYGASTGSWAASAEPVYVDSRVGKVVAYYDPNGVAVFPVESTVTESELTAQAYDETKLWYYDDTRNDVNNTNAAIAFEMKSVYTRLKLSIQRHATNYPGNCNITDVNIKTGTSFLTAGTFDIATGTVTGTPAAAGFTYALNSGNMAAGTTNTGYDVLLPPQSVGSGLSITLTVDGMNRSVTIPADQFTDSRLKAGNQYTVSLLITDTEISTDGTVAVDDFATGATVTSSGSV